ncbi:biliverdin-producing heme oxygenase [Jiulongibacter sp. NS-SX5]|uniref:biliverdin-producing heme oxygenase n=1 Tax=Jiulongibacter sp. NS-SX5 TaxID=3463854 RepID=UPI0040581931
MLLSEKLKESTYQSHIGLEKLTVPLIRQSTSRENYTKLLGLFYDYFNELDKKIADIAEIREVPDFSKRRSSSWLKQEIESLGLEVSDEEVSSAPQINSAFEALGAMYVMEGSTLGGQHITKMLGKLYEDKDHDFIFFNGYGEQTHAMWANFKEYLNSIPENAHDEVIKSANETFEGFAAHISLHSL